MFTPGRLIAALPSNDTPPIVRAVARTVADAARPVQDADEPDALPLKFATTVPFTAIAPVLPGSVVARPT